MVRRLVQAGKGCVHLYEGALLAYALGCRAPDWRERVDWLLAPRRQQQQAPPEQEQPQQAPPRPPQQQRRRQQQQPPPQRPDREVEALVCGVFWGHDAHQPDFPARLRHLHDRYRITDFGTAAAVSAQAGRVDALIYLMCELGHAPPLKHMLTLLKLAVEGGQVRVRARVRRVFRR